MATNLLFTFHSTQRSRFRIGELVSEWSSRYPQLFDEKDIELAANQPNYHFFEWLSAVMFYEATGYLSLLENYTAKNHLSKIEKFKEVVSHDVFEFSINNQSGLPDLFCFLPNTEDYFFCEVKGGRDRMRSNQDIKIKELEVLTGKNVWVINLQEINS